MIKEYILIEVEDSMPRTAKLSLTQRVKQWNKQFQCDVQVQDLISETNMPTSCLRIDFESLRSFVMFLMTWRDETVDCFDFTLHVMRD